MAIHNMTVIIYKININSMAKAITKQQVQEIQSGKLKMIDIRSKDEYEKLHLPEAINIPTEDLAKELKAQGAYIAPTTDVKFYCVSCAVHRGVVKVRSEVDRRSSGRLR